MAYLKRRGAADRVVPSRALGRPVAAGGGPDGSGEAMGDRMDVVLVEDHPLYRFALEHALRHEPRIRVVGVFGDAASAVAGIRELDPAVVVLDLELPDASGVSVIRALTAERSRARVLVLSGHVDGTHAMDAIRAGAAGYISKDFGADEIRDAILAIGRGETVFSPRIQEQLASSICAGGAGGASVDDLTQRERAVVALCADGLSRDEIGRKLHMSAATVKSHLGHIYGKLGVSGQAAAVAVAIRRGLV